MTKEGRWSVCGIATIIHLLITCVVAGKWTYNINNPYSDFQLPEIFQHLLFVAYIIAHIPLWIPELFTMGGHPPSSTDWWLFKAVIFAIGAGINSCIFGGLVEMMVNVAKAVGARIKR